ncbi:unnamed protein product, partial [Amoebophrya sp. A25]
SESKRSSLESAASRSSYPLSTYNEDAQQAHFRNRTGSTTGSEARTSARRGRPPLVGRSADELKQWNEQDTKSPPGATLDLTVE